ncbi:MAG TPA: hypothetical protein VF223_26630 [Trebonia sp.]
MIEQGDLRLLDGPVAQRLLHSTELSIAPLRAAGVSMGRIVLRPNWVGLIDFQARVPRPMAEAFA